LFTLNQRLAEGYDATLRRRGIEGCVQTAGATGAIFFTNGPVHNYRDACKASYNRFMVYWYGMLEHGIIPQAYGRDDSWTLTLSHNQHDGDLVLSAFDGIAVQVAGVQSEPVGIE
jgi:glutamate-1-semialdehyde 2,1-aminomutase